MGMLAVSSCGVCMKMEAFVFIIFQSGKAG